ncbi:MAG: polysaccharide deacetylase family protein [Solirubrobacteraceae bacterium]
MTIGVSITVDVDAETGLPDGGRAYAHRLSSRSERLYGLRRGLPRVLAALAEAEARATFYVPGLVAQRHPDEIRGIVAAGHELGHHGHTHRRPDTLSAREQRAELEDGLSALAAVADGRVRGYRAPGWELTPATLAGLGALGFTHDSSLMGDDRPHRVPAGAVELVELPVHWSLDDAPHFSATTDPAGLTTVWERECDCAVTEARHLTYTLHPEILGRPHRIDVLRRLLAHIAERGGRHVTHTEAAAAA